MDKLINKILEKNNPTVVGLDPRLSYVPEDIVKKCIDMYQDPCLSACKAILEFNKGIIDSVYDIVPAIKCQSACYEVYGSLGGMLLEDTIEYAKEKDLYVIVDGKRNDIGSTAECYSSAYLGSTMVNENEVFGYNCDCLTVNGYLGADGITPFIDNCIKNDKDIFALIKTSNPSSGDLQDLELTNGKKVYEQMGELVSEWGKNSIGEYGFSRIGGVVGATWPEQLSELRKNLPNVFFLVPGFGAQGGNASAVAGGFNDKHIGSIINNSRGIMCAYKKNSLNYKDGARKASLEMKDALNGIFAE